MNILLIGCAFEYSLSGYSCAHGVEARDICLANGFQKMGHRVTLQSTRETLAIRNDGIILYKEDRLDKYGAVVVIDRPSIVKANEIFGKEQLVKHGNVILLLDMVYRNTDGTIESYGGVAKHVGFLNAAHAAYYHKETGESSFFYTWGCPVVPTDLPNPYQSDKPKIIYFGIVDNRYLDSLNVIADVNKWEVWVGGLFYNDDGILSGISDEQRKCRCLKINFISDYTKKYSGNGPVIYGDHYPYFLHADVGLTFIPDPVIDTVKCKVHEYLGAGLPCVSEETQPANGLIKELDAGTFTPWNRPLVMIDAIEHELKQKRNRENIRQQAWRYSWDYAARVIGGYLG